MSMRSWEQEFYPRTPDGRWSAKKAVEHSLSKWTGLLKKNLKKHNVEKAGRAITDGKRFLTIASESCSLCVKYAVGYICGSCPLFAYLGHRCDAIAFESPYNIWTRTGDAQPMVRALRAILKEMEKQ